MKRKSIIFMVVLGLFIGLFGVQSYAGEKPIKIGWAEIDITPTGSLLPVDLRGQMYARVTTTVNDPLTATALAIESDSGEQWILVSIDTVDLGPGGGRETWPMDHEGMLVPLRESLQGTLLGFDLNKLTLVATHTHTAPYLNETIRHYYPTQEPIKNNPYYDFVKGKLEQVIQQAWNNRAYGGLSFEKGSAAVGFCRIVKYTDGHHEMYGDTNRPDFAGMLTPPDHTLELMYTFNPSGGLTGIMINIVSPSQVDESKEYLSADFWNDVRQKLRQTYGNDIFIMPYGGAAGDMTPRDLEVEGGMINWATRNEIGDMIENSVRERYPFAMNAIKYQVEMGHVVRDVNLTTKSYYHNVHPVYGESRPSYLAEIHAVRLDHTAWVNNPFELFNAWGKAIQNGSVATQTIIAQMSGLNRGGYLPTEEAVSGGTYSERTEDGWCDQIGGQQLVDNSVDMINSLFKDDTAPIARNDSVNTDEDTELTIDVLGNDTDPNGDTLYVISVTQPFNGFTVIAVMDGNDAVTYIPSIGFSGSDSFTYTISDSSETDTATVSVTVNSSTPPPATTIAINAGGSTYTSTDGTTYLADQYFNGGGTYSTTAAISGTEDDSLYQTERYGNPTYAIPVENGTYEVTVRFAELYYSNSSEIDFDVVIEGVLAADNLDVWDQVGKNAAYDVTATVTVSDGVLNISANNIKAIKISGDGAPPVDTTPPVITVAGSTPIDVVQGSAYIDAGATATDDVDGDITANIVTVNPVDANTVGIYTVTYNVSDAAGNAAQQVIRTVNVVVPPVDTTPPVITVLGSTPIDVVQGSAYIDAGATATDDVDGDITANIVTVNPVDANTVGIYTVTYNVSDAAGNAAQQVIRTVNVVVPPVDTTPPVITVLGSTPIDVVQGSAYIDAGATATDDVDGDITANIVTVNPVDANTVGIYTVTYNVSDAAGNAAQQVIRTVNVVVPPVDTTPPVITVLGSTPIDVVQGSAYIDAGATATDDVDGDITANIVTVNPVDANTVGIYTVTYNVSDAAGNAAQQVIRTVNVGSRDTDLILHWQFEESSATIAGDSSGNNLDGTLHNGPVWENNAAVGNGALTFDGIDDYVSVDSPALDFGSDDFTVAVWVKKLESTGDGWDNVWGVNKWDVGPTSNNNEWTLSLNDGGDDLPTFAIASGAVTYQINGSQNLTIGQWHHIAGVRSGNEIQLYVDGQLESTEYVGTASINNAGRDLRIANSAINEFQTHGTFDDLRIYSRALAEGEIQDIMNGITQPLPNTAPVANAGADKSVQINQTITITGSGTDSDGTITAYEWKKGAAVLATTASFDYTPTAVGTDTLTLTVIDNEGATASDSMNVVVTAPSVDTTPPVITVAGSTPIDVVQGSAYIDAGATATDDVDGDITANIVTVNPVDANTVGIYTVTYNVSDAAGNAAQQVIRTINVVVPPVDTTPPVITVVGSTPIDVVQGSAYIDAGATATDDVDGDITANIVTVNPVDANTVGIYTVTYNVSDAAGNAAQQVIRTVNVVVPPATTIAINAGGGAYTSTDGTTYLADQYFSGGSTYLTSAAISGTEDDALYQTERYGTTYSIPVENGTYEVTVQFAEIYYSNSSEIDFDVVIEGVLAADNLDVWDQVGKNAAYDVTATVTVSDGVLNISANNIKAIKISGDGAPQ